jgi:hypothetical protein
MKYTLSKSYPVLGAVISFASDSDEKATYDASVSVDLNDGEKDTKKAYSMSWAKQSENIATGEGYVNLFQRVDNPHNTNDVTMTLHGGPGMWEKIYGFSLVVEAEH